MPAHPDLIAQDAQFQKKLHQLADKVYSAVGYAASNVHFLVGSEGVVVIDTSETTGAAENILADFRTVCDLPINTIIYTHSHRDHISGATVFAEGRDVEVIASDNFKSDLVGVDESAPHPHKAMMARTKRQFGITLSDEERVSLGVGPGKRPMNGMGAGFLPPTVQFAGVTQIEREGFELELAKAPGETPDHMVVWWAAERILFCGDNFYHSFPNLSPLRGTPYREFDAWANTMDQLMAYKPAILATGHTLPVVGEEAIRQRLTDYRDAIRHVIAETVKGMNAGLDPVTIASQLKLPDDLATKPYLQEFYGHIGYASRHYFAGTLGWFDGNPTSIAQLPPAVEAARFVELAGGEAQVLSAAQDALDKGDDQWAMELADRLIALDASPAEARRIKVAAIRSLADQTINAMTRNYYLLSARELEEMD